MEHFQEQFHKTIGHAWEHKGKTNKQTNKQNETEIFKL